MTTIDELTGDALARANEVYASISFVPSCEPADRTFGVHFEGALIALGRINRHPDGSLEIGGFWVREDQRGAGLARRMVQAVIDELPERAQVFCVPFTHLTSFYLSFGMEHVAHPTLAPESIRTKMSYCSERTGAGVYHPTDLLVLRTP